MKRLLLTGLAILLLSSCASSQKKLSLKSKEPIYIQANSKDSYHFSLLVQRQLARYQTAIARSISDASTVVSINGPFCTNYVVFVDEVGQRRDYQVQCTIDYQVKMVEQGGKNISTAIKSSLRATALLTRADNLSAYFNREERVYDGLNKDLVNQLVLILATTDIN